MLLAIKSQASDLGKVTRNTRTTEGIIMTEETEGVIMTGETESIMFLINQEGLCSTVLKHSRFIAYIL